VKLGNTLSVFLSASEGALSFTLVRPGVDPELTRPPLRRALATESFV
jgi:hypothetical protein